LTHGLDDDGPLYFEASRSLYNKLQWPHHC